MKIPYLLSLVTWLPAVGALVVLFLFKKDQTGAIKRFATAWFALDFLVKIGLDGNRFRLLIGLGFLAIVFWSSDGVIGLWERWRRRARSPSSTAGGRHG